MLTIRLITPRKLSSSNVAIKKKGKERIRLRIGPKDLNPAFQRRHYPMRTIDEVAAQISSAKFFTVLDASSGF